MLKFIRAYCILAVALAALAASACAQSRPSRNPTATTGTLSISVPRNPQQAWLYLNGHLHNFPQPQGQPTSYVTMHTCSGWQFGDANGIQLRSSNETYTGIENFLPHDAAQANPLFYTGELTLSPGQYKLQFAMSATGTKNCAGASTGTTPLFPIVFTREYSVTVKAGQTANIYIALPEKYDFLGSPLLPAVPARSTSCRIIQQGATNEDLVRTTEQAFESFEDNASVKLLLAAVNAHAAAPSSPVVTLDTAGSSHELNGDEINVILSGLYDPRYLMPDHAEVATCRAGYPQFSKTLDVFDKFISRTESQLQSFHDLADSLNRAR